MSWTSPADWSPWLTALGGVAYFTVLYVGFALLSLALTKIILPRLGIGRVIDPRPLCANQVRREIGWSAVSVLIFGVGLLVPWGLVRAGWASVTLTAPGWRVALECLVLMLWNDVHFYAHHRLLHHPWFFARFHRPHHRSVVTTPWSTYAFHPVEALMLGSVMLLPMLAWPFSLTALALLPILSLTYNSLGHANYMALPRGWRWLSNARSHHLHHACFRGNYGFLFRFMDRSLGTELADDAADAVIRQSLQRTAATPPC